MIINETNTTFYRYMLSDLDFSNSRSLFCIEDGGTISFDAEGEDLVLTASLPISQKVNSELNLNKKLIRIYASINDYEILLATLIPNAPDSNTEDEMEEKSVDCYSVLWPVKLDAPLRTLTIPAGTNITAEVKRILIGNMDYENQERYYQGYGFTVNIQDSTACTTTDIDYGPGTSYVEICNDLLGIANYTKLFPDQFGNINATPYLIPTVTSIPNRIYNSIDLDGDFLVENIKSKSMDIAEVPNVFRLYNDEIGIEAIYMNNDPDSPTSTVNTFRHPYVEEVKDIAGDTLQEQVDNLRTLCKKEHIEQSKCYRTIEFNTPIDGFHTFRERIQLKQQDIRGNAIEVGWEITLDESATMHHVLQQLQYVYEIEE